MRYLQLGTRILLMLLLVSQGWAKLPEEGMWLPAYVKEYYEVMKRLGIELRPEEIYDENRPSLKDAIVQFGGFCSGSFISPEGLLITNHHCGYRAIQYHSTVERDYLSEGFWAKSREEELYVPDLWVKILVRTEDVTEQVIDENGNFLQTKARELIEAAKKEGVNYDAEVKEMFEGGQYLLFVYQRFDDVRLVGAPPSSIGKFGGDTDNWMWPRHTGDFSLFRVYAGKDNQPAPYSPDNVPYQPKMFLKISLKGVQEGDFTMIMGYPGSTERYLTSYEVEMNLKYYNPALIEVLGERLKIMKKYMDSNPQIRIQLASTYASLSNTYKYYVGQTEGLLRLKLIDSLRIREARIQQWIHDRQMEDAKALFDEFQKVVNMYSPHADEFVYLNAGSFSPTIVNIGFRLYRLTSLSTFGDSLFQKRLQDLKQEIPELYKTYYPDMDKEIMKTMLRILYRKMDPKLPYFETILKKYKAKTPEEAIDRYVEYLYQSSVCSDSIRFKAFLSRFNAEKWKKDPVYQWIEQVFSYYQTHLILPYQTYQTKSKQLRKQYIQILKAYYSDKPFYPDANFTLRLTYGTVKSYYPMDGAYYFYYTTHYGILQKYKPGDEEFDVPSRLITLLQSKDFGPYGVGDTLYTCFISTNDITGGNSGSPILNARGELIGVAFDGNWEAMTGDIVFDPVYKRTINVDIRYVLFLIDKFANASHLLKEMTVVQ